MPHSTDDVDDVRRSLVDAGRTLARIRDGGELQRVRWAVFLALWLLDEADDHRPRTCEKCDRPALRVGRLCVSHAPGGERHLAALARVSRRRGNASRPTNHDDVGFPWWSPD